MTVGYEDDVEDYLVERVEELGGICPKLIDIGRKGFPDRTVMLPGRQIYFIETKCKDGKVKPWQKRYHEELRSFGLTTLVIRTKHQVDYFLATYVLA